MTRAATNAIRWNYWPAEAFAELSSTWDEFNDNTFANALLRGSLISAALRHFGTGREQLAIAYDDRGIAAAHIFRLHHGVAEAFQPSQLPLGPWLQRRDVELTDLVSSFVRDPKKPLFFASLTQLDPLHTAFPNHGAFLRRLPSITMGAIEFPESLADYMRSRSGNLTANLRRREHKAHRELGSIGFEIIESPQRCEAGLDIYSAMESEGWKARTGTALARSTSQWSFYRDALAELCAQNRGRIYILRIGDQIAAASIAIVHRNTIYMLKTTHNERLRRFGPGMLLRYRIVASLYERENAVRRMEIYGPLNESQRPWVTSIREMYHINAYRAPAFGALHSFSQRVRLPLSIIARQSPSPPAAQRWPNGTPATFSIARRPTAAESAGLERSAVGDERPPAAAEPPPQSEAEGVARPQPVRFPRLGDIRRSFSAFGLGNGTLYAVARLMASVSRGRCRIFKYYFVAQPVPSQPLTRVPNPSLTRIYRVSPSDDIVKTFPRPPHVIAGRFASGAVCLVAERAGKLVGFIWLIRHSYYEDEVRCHYVLAPDERLSWDFDAYVEPAFRMSRAFLQLWDAANQFLRESDCEWTVSRISAFNPMSLASHRRLGFVYLGSGLFVALGGVQLSAFTSWPYFHVAFGPRACPELTFHAPSERQRNDARA